MVFTAQLGNEVTEQGTDVTEEVVIEEGSYVYCRSGSGGAANQFVEWGDLTEAERQGLRKVQDALSHAFITNREATADILRDAEDRVLRAEEVVSRAAA